MPKLLKSQTALPIFNLPKSVEGYWGDISEVPYNSFVDTCIVADTLNYLNETGATYNSAIQWINTSEVFNDDSGWGVAEGFESDIKRTVLALQALKAINHSDLETIGYALGYLTSNQNTNGGFGFFPENESNVYMTALVLKVLSSYSSTFNVQSSIDNAVAYLLTMQNVDGSFGEGTVYETALAFDALIASGPSAGSGQADLRINRL